MLKYIIKRSFVLNKPVWEMKTIGFYESPVILK